MLAKARALVIAALAGTLALGLAPAQGAQSPELQLRRVFEALREGRRPAALEEADRLVAQHPNFRLAHLVRGDLLLARVRTIEGLGNAGNGARERLEELRAEAAARLLAAREPPPPGRVPRYLLQSSPSERHAVVVDAHHSRVYVYENTNGALRLVEDFYASIGRNGIEKEREGDRKTPIGVYQVTSHIAGKKLPDLYGWGAFPLSYPNEWDRIRGRTGYGIWIHGVPADTYARAPQASDGCIALANPEIEQLATRVHPGTTPVVIARRIEWVPPETLRAERDALLRQLDAWRTDWESRDSVRYLGHYARRFRSDGMDLQAWSAHKRRANAAKSWIKVQLAGVSVYRDPGRQDMIVVTFDQDYRSSNLSQRSRKRQYWIVEDGRWKIAYEAPVSRPVLLLPESFRAATAGAAARGARAAPRKDGKSGSEGRRPVTTSTR